MRRPARDPRVPLRVGQPNAAVHDRERSGSRATLATKAGSEIKHLFLSAQIVRQFGRGLERRAHDRCVAGAPAQMAAQQIA